MPASPVIVSANVSNVKVDGEVLSGLQEASFKIENRQVQGLIKLKDTYEKFDSVFVAGQETKKSFLISIDLKRGKDTFQTFRFTNCHLKNFQLFLGQDGKSIIEYSFSGVFLGEKKPSVKKPRIGTSVQRRRIVR